MTRILTAQLKERYALVVRAESAPEQLDAALEAALPALFDHVIALGPECPGRPFLRYLGFTAEGRMQIEAGIQTRDPMPSGAQIESIVLPAGEAAMADVRGGSAELMRAHEALDQWMEQHGRRPAGPREEHPLEWTEQERRVRLIQPLEAA